MSSQSALSVVIIGALSAIAQDVARRYASRGCTFFLVARREEPLVHLATELRSLGSPACSVFVADVRHRDVHDEIVAKSRESLGTIDVVLVAHGVYPARDRAINDVDVVLDMLMVNTVSTISLIHRYATVLSAQRSGTIAVLSSVAGDRGRYNNYHYGSSKAALTAYMSGMRAHLADCNVNVLTIKPGPVATPMTTHHSMPFQSTTARVSKDIVNAIDHRKAVLYTPWFWRWIMVVVKGLPEWAMKRLRR